MYIYKCFIIILINLLIAIISFILNIAEDLSKRKQTVATWKLIVMAMIMTRIVLITIIMIMINNNNDNDDNNNINNSNNSNENKRK